MAGPTTLNSWRCGGGGGCCFCDESLARPPPRPAPSEPSSASLLAAPARARRSLAAWKEKGRAGGERKNPKSQKNPAGAERSASLVGDGGSQVPEFTQLLSSPPSDSEPHSERRGKGKAEADRGAGARLDPEYSWSPPKRPSRRILLLLPAILACPGARGSVFCSQAQLAAAERSGRGSRARGSRRRRRTGLCPP